MEVFFNTGTRRVLTVFQLVSVMQGVGTFQEFEVVDHVHPSQHIYPQLFSLHFRNTIM